MVDKGKQCAASAIYYLTKFNSGNVIAAIECSGPAKLIKSTDNGDNWVGLNLIDDYILGIRNLDNY